MTFYISNVAAGTVVSILGESTAADGEVVMSSYNSKKSQLWTYLKNSITSIANPNLVLDMNSGDGKSIITNGLTGDVNQVWFFSADGSIVNGNGHYMTVSTESTKEGLRLVGAVKKSPLSNDQVFSRVFV